LVHVSKALLFLLNCDLQQEPDKNRAYPDKNRVKGSQ